MLRLRDISIRPKLTIISMLTSGAALLLTCFAFALYERFSFRETMQRELATVAEMVGYNSTSALAFSDSRSAERTLHSLAADPHIAAACIYDKQGGVFATYTRGGSAVAWPPAAPEGARFTAEALELFRDIRADDEFVGRVFLRCDLVELRTRLQRYALIAGLVLILAGLAAYVIARRLQRLISEPVSHLSAIAGTVATQKNYALRASKHGNDELGQLIDAFNAMLGEIQIRDRELRAAHENLERRVLQRTEALRLEIAERRRAEETLSHQLRLAALGAEIGIALARQEPLRDILGQCVSAIARQLDLQLTAIWLFDPEREILELQAAGGDAAHKLSAMPPIGAGQSAIGAVLEARSPRLEELTPARAADHPWMPCGAFVFAGFPLVVGARSVGVLGLYSCRALTENAVRDLGAIAGTIALGILRMLSEAERAAMQRQLIDISRQAGMAEVATGVLHNVGNVLNSVNVSANLVVDRVRASRIENLGRLVDMFREHRANLAEFLTRDAKGRQVPDYLAVLSSALHTEREGIVEELQHLRKNIEHIKDIVAMQQSYARVSGVIELVPVEDLAEDALRINASSLTRHRVETVRDYQTRITLPTERHKVLQILINLVRNAKFACDESGRDEKHIIFRITADEASVRFFVIDNGVGIARENLTRIFAHGFSTRAHGHGFGLHSGALLAKELGGSLTAHSDGPGLGATFVLELPIKRADESSGA